MTAESGTRVSTRPSTRVGLLRSDGLRLLRLGQGLGVLTADGVGLRELPPVALESVRLHTKGRPL